MTTRAYPTPAEVAAAIFADPFITDPCREGTHDCRFAGCKCRGHRGTPRGTYCTMKTIPKEEK